MSGWNLPPGCTTNDIDRASGAVVHCTLCGREFDPTPEDEMHHELHGEWICHNLMCRDPDQLWEMERDNRG